MNTQKKSTIMALALLGATVVYVPNSSVVYAEPGAKTTHGIEASDSVIQAKLVTLYAINSHLNVLDIDTKVENQLVVLSGVVDSDIESDLAEQIATSVEGVQDVKNNLVVDKTKSESVRAQRRANTEVTWGQKIDDLTTTASIKSKLLANENIKGLDINVDTRNRNVTLSGKVYSSTEKELAEKIAENTNGVVKVHSNLQIVSKS